MTKAEKKKKGKLKMILPVVLAAALTVFGIWYVNDYYRAEASVEEYFALPTEVDSVIALETENMVFLDSTGTEYALIFYPGAKVEYTAYVPLLYTLAEHGGVDCFLLKMPANLAILDANAAGDIMEKYEYENWYLAGHSLGGAMAANFAAGNYEELDGLILLAAYPMKSLKDSGLKVVSIYGSEDLVLNRDNLLKGREFMPETYVEEEIAGGNHAWFGNYGEQDGDGVATITKEEQQHQTVHAMIEMIFGE